MPDAQAASISSNAWSSVSPWPKNSGAEPIPPKLPQPSPIRATVSPGMPPPTSATSGPLRGSLSQPASARKVDRLRPGEAPSDPGGDLHAATEAEPKRLTCMGQQLADLGSGARLGVVNPAVF